MRIVSGALKGRNLVAPPGQVTRPTSDRARQAVFNILEHAAWAPPLAGARVIDLFAGSGALGFEALSRGAAFCLFVETEAAARGAIRDNAEAFALFGRTTDLGVRPGADGPAFNLAFLDPPYGRGLGETALACLREGGWLAPGALAILETGAGEPTPETPGFTLLDARTWGAAKVWFLQLEGGEG